MLATMKRLALTALGALGLYAAVAKLRRTKASPDAKRLLEHLAMHTSASLPDLSSRLKLTAETDPLGASITRSSARCHLYRR